MARQATTLMVVLISFCPAYGGAIVELVPDDPGPYYGGESLIVDFWVHNQESFDARLRRIQLDFTETNPELSLDTTFTFDFSSLSEGDEYATLFPD